MVAAAGVASELVRKSYDARDTGRAMREIMAMADATNQLFDMVKPGCWRRIRQSLPSCRCLLACSIPVQSPERAARARLARTDIPVAQEFFGLDRNFQWADVADVPRLSNRTRI